MLNVVLNPFCPFSVMNFMDYVKYQASLYHCVSELFREFFELVKSNSFILIPVTVLFAYYQFKTEFSVWSAVNYPLGVQNQKQTPFMHLGLMERGSPQQGHWGGSCHSLLFCNDLLKCFYFSSLSKFVSFIYKPFSCDFWWFLGWFFFFNTLFR